MTEQEYLEYTTGISGSPTASAPRPSMTESEYLSYTQPDNKNLSIGMDELKANPMPEYKPVMLPEDRTAALFKKERLAREAKESERTWGQVISNVAAASPVGKVLGTAYDRLMGVGPEGSKIETEEVERRATEEGTTAQRVVANLLVGAGELALTHKPGMLAGQATRTAGASKWLSSTANAATQGGMFGLGSELADKLSKGDDVNLWNVAEKGALFTLFQPVEWAGKILTRGLTRVGEKVTGQRIPFFSKWRVKSQALDNLRNGLEKGVETPESNVIASAAAKNLSAPVELSTPVVFEGGVQDVVTDVVELPIAASRPEIKAVVNTLAKNGGFAGKLDKQEMEKLSEHVYRKIYSPESIDDLPASKLADTITSTPTWMGLREALLGIPEQYTNKVVQDALDSEVIKSADFGAAGRMMGTAHFLSKRSEVVNAAYAEEKLGTMSKFLDNIDYAQRLKPFNDLDKKDAAVVEKLFLDHPGVELQKDFLGELALTKEIAPKHAEAYRAVVDTMNKILEVDANDILEHLNKLKVDAPDSEQISVLEDALAAIRGAAGKGYIPRTRTGNYRVVYTDPGRRTEFAKYGTLINAGDKPDEVGKVIRFFNTKGEAKNFMQYLDRLPGVKVQDYSPVKRVTRQVEDASEYDAVRALSAAIGRVDGDKIAEHSDIVDAITEHFSNIFKERGFRVHKIAREDRPGFETGDLQKNVMDYVTGWIGSRAKSKKAIGFKRVLNSYEQNRMQEVGEEYNFAKQFAKDMLQNRDAWAGVDAKLGAIVSLRYLGFKLGIPVRDVTQTLITGIPQLASNYPRELQGPLGGAKASYEIMKAVKDLITKNLTLEEKAALTADISKIATLSRDTIKDKSWLSRIAGIGMKPQAWAEKQRSPHYLAAYRLFRSLGHSPDDAIKLANNDVLSAHWDYSRANKPSWLIQEGGAAGANSKVWRNLVYKFQEWPHNFWQQQYEFIRKGKKVDILGNVTQKDRQLWLAAQSLATRLALGGIKGSAAYTTYKALVEWRGGVEKADAVLTDLDDQHPALAMAASQGVPAAVLPISFSQQINGGIPFQGILDFNNIPIWKMVQDIQKTANFIDSREYLKAFESSPLTPAGVAAASRSEREAWDGSTTQKGNVVTDENGMPLERTVPELMARMVGLQTGKDIARNENKTRETRLADYYKTAKDNISRDINNVIKGNSINKADVVRVMGRMTRYNDALSNASSDSGLEEGQYINGTSPFKGLSDIIAIFKSKNMTPVINEAKKRVPNFDKMSDVDQLKSIYNVLYMQRIGH